MRSGDPRLLGAIAWWGFDIAVLWACFHAFGASPPKGVIVMAYFVGMIGNTLPLPGGIGGVDLRPHRLESLAPEPRCDQAGDDGERLIEDLHLNLQPTPLAALFCSRTARPRGNAPLGSGQMPVRMGK